MDIFYVLTSIIVNEAKTWYFEKCMESEIGFTNDDSLDVKHKLIIIMMSSLLSVCFGENRFSIMMFVILLPLYLTARSQFTASEKKLKHVQNTVAKAG